MIWENGIAYGDLKVMQKFELKHEELHATVAQIVKLKLHGNKKDAEVLYTELVAISDEIIELLNQAETEIGNKNE